MLKNLNSVLQRSTQTILPHCSEDLSLAEFFLSFLVNKISRIQGTPSAVSSPMVPLPHSAIPNFLAFENISTEDVRKMITASPTKSCSLDPWLTFLIKDCPDILITPITELVNMSYHSDVFPDELKQAIVTPLIIKPSLCSCQTT